MQADTLARMSRTLGRLLLGAVLSAPLCLCAMSRGQADSNAQGGADYDKVDAFQTALRTLRDGLVSGSEGQQHATVLALRELRDPSLLPLFEAFVDGDRWALRVDGILGLAELDGSGKVDIAKVERLPGERDRDAAISAMIALKLVDAAQLRAMLEWIDLPSSQRVLLAGELRRLGGAPDAALLARLANSKTPEVAGFATCILLDMQGADAARLSTAVRTQIAALPPASRSAAVAQIAEASAVDGLVGAAPFVAELLRLPELSEDARMRGLGSLLTLSPTHAYPLLQAGVTADSSQGSLMRHVAVLIASGARPPAEVWAAFDNGDSMMLEIIAAGKALSSGDEKSAYARLVGLERRVLLRAALDGARRIGPSAERELALACLALVLKPGPTPPQLSETLLLALFRLASMAPEELRAPLATEGLDEPTREAMLMALLNAGTKEAAEVARTMKGKTSRLGEGQIAVLHARNADSLEQAELDELMRVAGGAVKVAMPVRQQAAWLWMKHAKRSDEATAALRQPASRASNADGDAVGEAKRGGEKGETP
ncbi:MAG: hypothetical protein RLZZ116_1580 [Planctomycetota bacterium]